MKDAGITNVSPHHTVITMQKDWKTAQETVMWGTDDEDSNQSVVKLIHPEF